MKALLFTAVVAAVASAAGIHLRLQSQVAPVTSPSPRSVPEAASHASRTPSDVVDLMELDRATTPRGKVPAPEVRTFISLDKMHDTYFDDFSKKPGFGARRIQYLPPVDYLTLGDETYRFAVPDLLGLEDEPLAYVRRTYVIQLRDLTNHTSRAALARRPLTPMEVRAVAELRDGKDISVIARTVAVRTAHGTNEVAGLLAVGALRAKAQCAECHQVKEGTLLGAFSYTLVPTNMVAPRVLATLGRQ